MAPVAPTDPRLPRREDELLPVDYRPRLRQAPLCHPAESLALAPAPGPSNGFPKMVGVQGLARVALTAKRVVFVLDRSISMALHGYLDVARRELADGLRHLPPESHFQVILYQRFAVPLLGPLPARLHTANPTTIDRAVTALQAVTAEGPTHHLAGLEMALVFQPDAVVWLTDEDDLQPADELAILKRNRGATLHIVELRRGPRSQGAFARLARATGGSHRRFTADTLPGGQ
ncbi:MAG: hypothetical protein SNJ75_08180 [Gemmataceae bacterium]